MNTQLGVDVVEIPGYYMRHCVCPRCGTANSCGQTLIGILRGRDINKADCQSPGCGWSGLVHDLMPDGWSPFSG